MKNVEQNKHELNQFKNKNFFVACKNAIDGIIYNLRSQKNAKIQLLFAIIVLLLSCILELEITEMVCIVLSIGLVFISETVNTAIETTVDLVTEEYNLKAKIAKDVASGAVLISALISITVGILIFGDKVLSIFF